MASRALANRSRRVRVGLSVWIPAFLAVGLAALALFLLSSITVLEIPDDPAWIGMILAFGVAELTIIHFEFRKQTVSWPTTEVPMVVGLFLFGPAATVIASAVAVAVVVITKSYRPVKAVFNVAVAVVEVALAGWLLQTFRWTDVTSPDTWFGVVGTLLFTGAVSIGCIALAILLTEGSVSPSFWLTLIIPLLVIVPLAATVGVVVLLLIEVSAWAVILAAVMVGAFVLLYRRYAAAAQDRRTLAEVYEFAELVQQATGRNDGAHVVLEAVREKFNAERGAFWVPAYLDQGPRILATSTPGSPPYPGPADPDDDIRRQVLTDDRVRLFVRGPRCTPGELASLNRRAVNELLAVPLQTQTHERGYLEICERSGSVLDFSAADVELLQSLATHVEAFLLQRQLQRKIRYDAAHDQVTDLPNRFWLTAIVDAQLDPAGRKCGVLVADIDGFAQVNETLGHAAGDELLRVIASALREHAPPDAQVAWVGGAQFAVVLPDADLGRAEEEADRLRRAVSSRVEVAGLTLTVELTLGISAAPTHGESAGSLLQRADVAMLAARAEGLSARVYSAAMDERSLRMLRLGSEFADAIDSPQISVHFQPIVATDSGQIAAVEALARWTHPQLGAVAPDEFIPLAERIGLISQLTWRVLGAGLALGRAWQDEGVRMTVAVNLSSLCLAERGFVEDVERMLCHAQYPADLLTFEITEGSLVQDAVARSALQQLHDLGVGLSADDFGTGYSSLSYLSKLPIDEVKIDKSFVLNMRADSGSRTIARSIIELAHDLNLRVVAEGVEDEATRDLLAEMGCDFLQGYHFSRPVSEAALADWLAERNGNSRPGPEHLQARLNVDH